jgi:hypothetical protein
MHLVPGAGHRFGEPNALDDVIAVTTRWLRAQLAPTARAAR